MKQNFLKNKVGTGKISFFVICTFCTTVLFVLKLAYDMAVLYGNVECSILVLST